MSGRSLKSRNKITVGHLVKKLECSISVVKKSAGQVCDFCFATLESRKRCSRCQKLFYCSRSCQLNDWKFHQQECPFLSQINETIPGFVRLLGKCSYSWHQEKNAKTTNDIDFSALYEDVENVTENEKLRYAEMMTLLKQFLGSKTFDMYFETPISCMKLINQVVRNTTTICSEELDEIGYGLYYEASIINHSCEPNAVFTFKGTNLAIRAIKNIAEGEEVFVSYTDQLALKSDRQKVLSEQFNFTCFCIECVNQTREKLFQSWKCEQPNCSGYFSNLQETCSVCQRETFHEIVPSFQDSDLENADYESMIALLKKNEKEIPDFNLRMHNFLLQLSNNLMNSNQFENCLPFELRIMENYRKYFEGNHPLKSLQLAKIAKLYSFLGNLKLAIRYFEQALRSVMLTHGEESLLYSSLTQQYNMDRLDYSHHLSTRDSTSQLQIAAL